MAKELEDWFDYIVIFSNYCREPAKERWMNDIGSFLARANSYRVEEFNIKKDCYSIAAEFIKMIHDGESWEDIKKLFDEKAKTPMYKCIVGNIMLSYSKYPTEFIEQVIDLEEANWYADLVKRYDERKLYEEMQTMNY